jgi:menaquinone-dependent protoporphyrinogen oxidase
LSASGTPVDVRLVENTADVDTYQAVIVGSAIRFGSPLPEAIEFLEAYKETLSQVPVAYFSLGTAMQENTQESRREASGFLDGMREIVQSVDVGLFGGVMDFGKLAFVLQPMAKLMSVPADDYRDWDAIRAWAQGLQTTLMEMRSDK